MKMAKVLGGGRSQDGCKENLRKKRINGKLTIVKRRNTFWKNYKGSVLVYNI